MAQKSLFALHLFVLSVSLISCKSAILVEETEPSISLGTLEEKISSFKPDPKYRDDKAGLIALQEALAAVKEGNHGIGACLVREKTGEVVQRGHNRVYQPFYRSDLHAEMDTLTGYEERVKAQSPNVEGLVLYVSLEPCPMCLTRIIISGVQKVYYLAPDPDRGMAHLFKNLPPAWQKIAEGRIYEPAQCSPEMKYLANEVFKYSLNVSAERLKKE
jgi:tRNA(adenine34) deaminase